MQVCFTNLGCKLNQAELEGLARDFAAAGHRVTNDLQTADLHVLNTCTVTHVAARDSRKAARRGRRINPAIRTVLTGCYVAEDPREAHRATGADLLVPNHEKANLLDAVQAAFPELTETAGLRLDGDLPYAPLEFGNARALVKIEDGCNMQCTFCIIPSTRGEQRSRASDDILAEVRGLSRHFPEIVVTGVQISAYRHQGVGLYELTERLLSESSAKRLRLTSIAPWQFDRRLLDLFDAGRLCRHVHLSLQSGCTETLARMRRPYRASQFAELVEEIRGRVPDMAITTDVIAGFPGETDDEFETSLAFVEAMAFARVHVFPYSMRPGTEAARLPDPVNADIKKDRVRRLLATARTSEERFVERQLGKQVEVLWETCRDGVWLGTSDNYLRVRTQSNADLSRRLTRSILHRQTGSFGETRLEANHAA